jgi:hypothetical protein
MYYDWICHECEAIWEQEHPLGEAPKKTECPECGELRERNWSSVTTFKMKGDCHSNRSRAKKYQEKGLDKDSAHEFYREAEAASKRAINTGWSHYSKVTPKYDEWAEKGALKRRSVEEKGKAVEKARQMTLAVYDGQGKNPAKLDFNKPQ